MLAYLVLRNFRDEFDFGTTASTLSGVADLVELHLLHRHFAL